MLFFNLLSSIVNSNIAYILSYLVLLIATKVLVYYIRERPLNKLGILFTALVSYYCLMYQYAATRWVVFGIGKIIPVYDNTLWTIIESTGFVIIGSVCVVLCLKKCSVVDKGD